MWTLYSLAASLLVALPVSAQGALQWRTTECQVQDSSGQVIARNRCQAGFAHDTAIRAIKYWDNNRWIYNQVGQDGATFGQDRECIYVRYDNQESQLFCTIKSPEQLGIKGD